MRETLVALVDATLTMDAEAWCGEDGKSPPGLWVARPPSADRSAEAPFVAEQLLRTGAFGLVVLDGVTLNSAAATRLRAVARESDAALLVSTVSATPTWQADVSLEFARAPDDAGGLQVGGYFRRRAVVRLVRSRSLRPATRDVELDQHPRSVLKNLDAAPDRRSGARK